MLENLSLLDTSALTKAATSHADAASRRRLKVLVNAFACSPTKGSEQGVGWGWIRAIAKYHDLWVLTSDEYRKEIEEEVQRWPDPRHCPTFYYLHWRRHTVAERIWPPEHLINYRKWQDKAYVLGRRLHHEIQFDIVHQLTYVGYRVPGHLWQLDAPFVWGPIGGLEQVTWSLLPSLGLYGALYFGAKNLLNDLDRRFSRLPRRAFAAAEGGIIAATTGIQRQIERFYGRSSVVISEIGLPPVTTHTFSTRSATEPLRLLWCGLLLPGKALPFLLAALSNLPSDLDWRLAIIGSGPCESAWRKCARKYGVTDRLEWLGTVPRTTVLEYMQQAHALTVTSVYDLTSTVVVEALANGLPVICPDRFGFKDAITADSGIRFDASSRMKFISGLRESIVRISDEQLRLRLSRGALAQSSNYEWEIKALALDKIYRAKHALGNSQRPVTNREQYA
jgi:glycosyltransferase involved in cell wall biosynthesis